MVTRDGWGLGVSRQRAECTVLSILGIVLISLLPVCDARHAEPSGDTGSEIGPGSPTTTVEVPLPETDSAPQDASPRASLDGFRPPPEVLADLPMRIDDSFEGSMDHFYRRLLAVARGESGAVARISVYAVSTNASDWVTSALRHALQERYGDGGKGFVPITPGWGAQVHQDVAWSSRGWRPYIVNRGEAPLGRYGLGGVLATNIGRRSQALFGTVSDGPSNRSLSRFRLFYQAWPRGGEVEIRFDTGELALVSTRAEAPVDRIHEVRVSPGEHEIVVRPREGQLRLYGVVLENEGPGVVVDALTLLGISTRQLVNFDLDHLSTQFRQRESDLVIFWLGGPDAMRTGFTREGFVERYGEVIGHVRRGRPEASCLVVSTLDKAYEFNGRVRSRRRVAEVVAAQEAVARARGCAFFDLYSATGGEGTLARWDRERPRFVAPDLTHLTLAGARHVASLLERALLRGFDDFLVSE